MTRTRLAGLAAAMALALAALWVIAARDRERPGGGSETALGSWRMGGDRSSSARGVSVRDSDPRGTHTVSGTVIDAQGQAVGMGSLVLRCLRPDGEVERIDGGVVRIGPDGEFEGPGCAFEVCAELRHPTAVAEEGWVLRPSEPVQLRVRGLARFDGEVLGGGEPIPGATVTFTRPAREDVDPIAVTPFMTRSTTTDADGRFSVAWIERPPCDPCQQSVTGCDQAEVRFVDEFVVTVRAVGFGPAQRELSIDDARSHGVDEPVRIELPPSADILSGRLVDPDGRRYPRAYVLARSDERPTEQRRGEVSGEDFEIDGLGEGTYEVRALQDGVELARRDAVAAGQDLALTGSVPADGPEVTLVVRDPQGRPVVARIDGGPFRDARTDERGRVTAAQVLPGALRLRVRVPGAKSVVRQVEIPLGPPDPSPRAREVQLDLVVGAERP